MRVYFLAAEEQGKYLVKIHPPVKKLSHKQSAILKVIMKALDFNQFITVS